MGAEFLHEKLLPKVSKKVVLPGEDHFYCKKPEVLGRIVADIIGGDVIHGTTI